MIDNKVEDIRKHMSAILDILEIKITPSTENTALRIAKMYCNELFENRNGHNIDKLNSQMKLFPAEGTEGSSVQLLDIPFTSMCEHHFLPFYGTVGIYYVPDKSIIGLSKIPRVVRYFSKRPQLQERLTSDIGQYLVDLISPLELSVKAVAKHECVMCRGIESDCSTSTVFKWKKS